MRPYGVRDTGGGVLGYTDTGTGTPTPKSVLSTTPTKSTSTKTTPTIDRGYNTGGGARAYTDAGTGTSVRKQQTVSRNDNNTSSVTSVGYSITYGLCVDGNYGASYVWDKLGNRGVAITVGIGGGLASSPSQSINVLAASNMSSINEMRGWGVSIGSTLAIVSMEAALGKDSYGVFVGGWPGLGIEFHANISYTWVIPIGGMK